MLTIIKCDCFNNCFYFGVQILGCSMACNIINYIKTACSIYIPGTSFKFTRKQAEEQENILEVGCTCI